MDETTLMMARLALARRRAGIEKVRQHMLTKHPKHEAKRQAVADDAAARRARHRKRVEAGAPCGRWGETLADRTLLEFEGGEWFANSDLGKRLGVTVQIAQWETRRGLKNGWLERLENADYAGKPHPQARQKEQPKFLWRVTAQGRARAAFIKERAGEPKPSPKELIVRAHAARKAKHAAKKKPRTWRG